MLRVMALWWAVSEGQGERKRERERERVRVCTVSQYASSCGSTKRYMRVVCLRVHFLVREAVRTYHCPSCRFDHVIYVGMQCPCIGTYFTSTYLSIQAPIVHLAYGYCISKVFMYVGIGHIHALYKCSQKQTARCIWGVRDVTWRTTYICVCMYVCMYICICIYYTYIYIYIHISLGVHVHVSIEASIRYTLALWKWLSRYLFTVYPT